MFVCCVTVCVSVSLLAVVGPGRPSLLKEHKGNCCGSSCPVVQYCVCVCVRAAVSWSCRADRPGSHGAGSSCVLCCRSGSLSHWSVVGTVSCREQPRKTAKRLFFCFVLIFPLISLILQSTLLFICLIHSFFGPFCLLNLLFFPLYLHFWASLSLHCLLGLTIPLCLFEFISYLDVCVWECG